jgi:hypothetical protein
MLVGHAPIASGSASVQVRNDRFVERDGSAPSVRLWPGAAVPGRIARDQSAMTQIEAAGLGNVGNSYNAMVLNEAAETKSGCGSVHTFIEEHVH